MKINSSICKQAIVQRMATRITNMRVNVPTGLLQEKNWKRLSKHGNAKRGFCRRFYNTETGIVMNVHSTETRITEIKPSGTLAEFRQQQKSKKEFLPAVRDQILKMDPRYLEWPGRIVSDLPFSSLPKCKPTGDPDDCMDTPEEVDFENCEVIEVKPDRIRMCAGGDWQPPVEFDVILDEKGCFTYDRKTVKQNSWSSEGMSKKEFLETVFDNDVPDSILNPKKPSSVPVGTPQYGTCWLYVVKTL